MPEPKLPADIQVEAAKAMHIELNRGMSVGVTAWNGVGTRDSYLAAVTAVADVVKPWHQDTLQARVAELEASNLHLLWVEGRAYHSRIAQLTRALTGVFSLWTDDGQLFAPDEHAAIWERARTALAPCSFCGAAENNNPWCCNARLTTEEIAERQQQARNKTADKGKT